MNERKRKVVSFWKEKNLSATAKSVDFTNSLRGLITFVTFRVMNSSVINLLADAAKHCLWKLSNLLPLDRPLDYHKKCCLAVMGRDGRTS